MQRVNQFIAGTADTHTFLINYGTQMLYMYITRNGKVKSCVTSPYYQSMPPPNMFAGASFVVCKFPKTDRDHSASSTLNPKCTFYRPALLIYFSTDKNNAVFIS